MTHDGKLILITGANGSIGSRLAQRFSAAGVRVRALVRDLERSLKLRDLAGVEIVRGDLTQPESLLGCMDGCAVVYHCAAKLVSTDWRGCRQVNVGGTQALLEEAVSTGIERFIHLSTIGVYVSSEGDAIAEDFPWPKSNNPYFRTKQDAESAVQAASRAVPVVILRVGDVIGPGQYAWTVDFIERIKKGTLLPPTDAESGILNPVYIDNLLDALLVVRSHPAALGQVFNIVDETPIPMSDYIRRLARMTGKRVPALPGFLLKAGSAALTAGERLRGHPVSFDFEMVDYMLRKGLIDGGKARSRLGWAPAVGLEEGFRRTEEWLRAEGYLAKA